MKKIENINHTMSHRILHFIQITNITLKNEYFKDFKDLIV